MDFIAQLWQHPVAVWLAGLAATAGLLGFAIATTGYSTQVTKIINGLKNAGVDYGGNLKTFDFDYTQGSTAGTTGSTVELIRVPPGRWILHLDLSRVEWSAMGTGSTMDIGYSAYTAPDGTAVVADTDAFDDDVDVAALGNAIPGSDLAVNLGKRKLLESRDGVTIIATIVAIPAAAQLHGRFTLSN